VRDIDLLKVIAAIRWLPVNITGLREAAAVALAGRGAEADLRLAA